MTLRLLRRFRNRKHAVLAGAGILPSSCIQVKADFEIGRILHLKSRNPKSPIGLAASRQVMRAVAASIKTALGSGRPI